MAKYRFNSKNPSVQKALTKGTKIGINGQEFSPKELVEGNFDAQAQGHPSGIPSLLVKISGEDTSVSREGPPPGGTYSGNNRGLAEAASKPGPIEIDESGEEYFTEGHRPSAGPPVNRSYGNAEDVTREQAAKLVHQPVNQPKTPSDEPRPVYDDEGELLFPVSADKLPADWVRPSVEEFVARGYKAENYESFFLRHENVLAKRLEASRKATTEPVVATAVEPAVKSVQDENGGPLVEKIAEGNSETPSETPTGKSGEQSEGSKSESSNDSEADGDSEESDDDSEESSEESGASTEESSTPAATGLKRKKSRRR